MFRGTWFLLFFLAIAPLSSAPATAATTPSQVCEAAKLKAQANFTKCRLAADATNAKTPSPTKRDAAYTKCAINLATAYSKAEAKAATAGASCPTTGDRADIDDLLRTCTLEAREATSGNPCTGVACDQAECPVGTTTSVSGTVYAPNGTLPIPNAIVYVPNGAVSALPEGASCDPCGAPLGATPLVQTVTDATGHFVLTDVPAADDVPLVVQIGKWRRQALLPTVPPCVDTAIDPNLIRLPRTRQEGNIPSIAVSTGGADAVECLVRKIGIADSEFGTIGAAARVHLYAGTQGTDQFDPGLLAGSLFAGSTVLWSSLDSLRAYDMVLLSCEGNQNPGTKSAQSLQALKSYADLGGRVYVGHWHDYWLQAGPPPWPSIFTFNPLSDLGALTADIDSASDGGRLADWLLSVGASPVHGQLGISGAKHATTAVNASLGRRWIYKDVTANGAPTIQLGSFTTPVEQPTTNRCGRVVLSDIHVVGDSSASTLTFPSGGCTSNVLSFTPQEKALAFMIFHLGACIDASGQ